MTRSSRKQQYHCRGNTEHQKALAAAALCMHTSWASQDVARRACSAVDWPCPAQYYKFDVIFDTVFIMYQQQLESLPDFIFVR